MPPSRPLRAIGLALAAALTLPCSGCTRDAPAPDAGAPDAAVAPSIALTPPPPGAPAAPELPARIAAVRAAPERADGWVELGRAWIRTARLAQREDLYRRADACADEALRRAPDHRQARHLRAMVHRVGHRFAEVKAIAEALVASDPTDDTAWALLADAAVALGDLPGAERAIDRLLALRPAMPAFSRAAWLRWLHGDVPGALEMWGEALRAGGRQDPEPRAWALSEIGHLQWHRGELGPARAAYDLALKALPTHAGALFGRGRVKLAEGDPAGAAKDFAASSAARVSEATTEWHALALRSAGRPAEADALDAKLDAAGAFDDPRTIALYLAHRARDPKRAVERARADFATRQDIYAHDALGFALLRAGDLAGAAKHLEEATRHGTPDAMLLAHRGLLEHARGDTAAAREWLDRAWQLNRHVHPRLMAEVATARAALGAAP